MNNKQERPGNDDMKRLIGFSVLCFAFGMLFMLVIGNIWIGLILITIFIIVGYNLFSCSC